MNIINFKELHLNLKVVLPKTKEFNPLASETDPTQDIPIRNIEVSALGVPLNVKELKAVFSGVTADNLTSIEKRNNDKFDVLGELQDSAKNVSKVPVKTNFINSRKKQKKHE